MKKWAIILSAGKGTRMKSEICKQYILVDGKPVLFYALNAFEKSNIDNVIIVTGKNDIDYVKKEIVEKYHIKKVSAVIEGGKERYNSVMNGLNYICGEGIVLIHDGARPLVKVETINRIIDKTLLYGACVAGVKVKDTIKIADENECVKSTPNRNLLWQIQTPQAFTIQLIKEAYSKMSNSKDNTVTDDSMVVEKYTNVAVKIIDSDYMNIKITTPEDIFMVESMLKKG